MKTEQITTPFILFLGTPCFFGGNTLFPSGLQFVSSLVTDCSSQGDKKDGKPE